MTHLQAKRVRKKRRRKQRRTARLRVTLLVVLGLVGGILVLGGLALNREIRKVAQETARLNIKTLGQNTAIYDRYGHLLGIVAGEQNRTIVASSQIPTGAQAGDDRHRGQAVTTSITASTTCASPVPRSTTSSAPADCRAPRRSQCSS